MSFKNIALFGRQRADKIADTLDSLKQLLQQRKLNICIDKESADIVNIDDLPTVEYDQLGKDCDLMVVVGGDGSLLKAAHAAAKFNTPVLGVNKGRLGFLTDISPQELEQKIDAVLSGKYSEENRFLLSTDIEHRGKSSHLGNALNDVVLSPGDIAHMIEFEIYVDQQFVCKQRADGLIVATPTGSTAYALSGGGPILHPALDAVALVPMFPHTLSNRPIVVDGDSEITIKVSEDNDSEPRINYDGQARAPVKPGDIISIKKHPQQLRLVHPQDYNYYQTLRSKLGWQTKYSESC